MARIADGKQLRIPSSNILDELGPPLTATERVHVAEHVIAAVRTVADSRLICEMLGLFDPQIATQLPVMAKSG